MDPLRIGVLTSRRAAGMARLLGDPNRGSTWQLGLVVSSESHFEELGDVEKAGVPLELRPGAIPRNLREREHYDTDLADLLLRNGVDWVLLDGYQYILTEAFLHAFPGKVLAIHDADLSIRDRSLYCGTHAVRDAIFEGVAETRSSVYVVTRDVGRGPLFLLSAPYPVATMARDARERGDADFLDRYAVLHRDWMLESAWGEMLARTIELLVGGSVRTLGDVVWVDGAPGPCRMGEAPAGCHDPEAMVARGIPRSCPFFE